LKEVFATHSLFVHPSVCVCVNKQTRSCRRMTNSKSVQFVIRQFQKKNSLQTTGQCAVSLLTHTHSHIPSLSSHQYSHPTSHLRTISWISFSQFYESIWVCLSFQFIDTLYLS
jgi:hypothetical protein